MPPAPDFGPIEKYRTSVVIVVALAGGALGWVIIFFGYWPNLLFAWTALNKHFARDPRFLFWLFLQVIQVAAWPIMFIIVTARIREIGAYSKGNYGEIALSALLFSLAALAVALVGVFAPTLPGWLPGYEAKLTLLSVLAVAVGLTAAIGLWLCQGALRKLLEQVTAANKARKQELDRLLHLKDSLALFLLVLGTLLSLAIFAASAERRAVAVYGHRTKRHFSIEHVFPTNYIFLYGLLFSILIALAYAPAHITFQAAGRKLRDTIVPMLEPGDPGWQARLTERKSFEDLLELQVTTAANLRVGIAALSPLLASVTGLLSG
jgi:hypothetical protein